MSRPDARPGPARRCPINEEPKVDADQVSSVEPIPRRHRTTVMAIAALAVVAFVGGLILWPGGESAAPATTTSTSSSTTSTTAGPEQLPAGTFQIATAKPSVSLLQVRSTPPDPWESTPLSTTTELPPTPPASQPTVPLRVALPTPEAPIVGRTAVEGGWVFENPGPYTPKQPFSMMVLEHRGDWVKVAVPVRPNGTEGWVAAADVDLSTTQRRIEVRLGERMLRAYDGSELVFETPVVVGSAFTQTPTGRFYVTDIVPQDSASYGPVALATDGYSEMIDEFDNGVPVIALHGTNRPELVGQAVSNGCIRVPNELIQQLADTVPRGAPVDIWP
jgi:lipoprotein-anchoring transpeptidase ErfK/SrfK